MADETEVANQSETSSLTDDELNAAIATEVMGWAPHRWRPETHWSSGYQRSPCGADYWDPATDYGDAFEVVERMRELNAPFWQRFANALIEWVETIDPGDSEVGHFFEPLSFVLYYLTPRAICEAALAAVREAGG